MKIRMHVDIATAAIATATKTVRQTGKVSIFAIRSYYTWTYSIRVTS